MKVKDLMKVLAKAPQDAVIQQDISGVLYDVEEATVMRLTKTKEAYYYDDDEAVDWMMTAVKTFNAVVSNKPIPENTRLKLLGHPKCVVIK